MGLIFSEIYPVSLSDSNNKEKSDVIRWVEKENEIVSDKGFAIQDFWSTKGFDWNCLSQKIIEFSVATNFGIAAISSHIEKSTRRVRYWSIWIMFDQLKKWININVAEYMSHFQSTIPTTWSKNWTKWDRKCLNKIPFRAEPIV